MPNLNTIEEVKESAWNLCKEYDSRNKRRDRVMLTNFVSLELERIYRPSVENLYREEWLEEVAIFCNKYGYSL